MALSLFQHNREAYEAALFMLSEKGKAAIIHPTGTGKSFIGFKLCEDFPASVICWMSPSEYIFKTQMENLKSSADGWEPQNVRFFTYAKLMLMSEDEMKEIQPDYIILDEFHRCGAEMWGAGVETLLSLFPNVPVLGLSATAVRYLDNQRNMADELFDNNIASEMTLGEAIVRGILNEPKYVLSVFAYQNDYNRIKSRVRRAKNRAVRDQAERYLEALRRALEMADGLDIIFDKHITERTGKYIVFCSNIEHLKEMQGKVHEWFDRIDKAPHIYTAYSDDPTTDKAFAEFKSDSSDHLKLLFAIDMLNEGVHVDDVNGVILFRPTVSPIIYKQQIGRALSASKSAKSPVIFDIVNNIENLYAIGTIQQEMQVAVNYYRSIGQESMIVNDHFEVIDEVRNTQELFEKLNDTLSASWEMMYAYAKQYYEQHGDLNVPTKYKTEEGYSLGHWLMTQRRVYAGETYGKLDESRIEKLNAIGMRWGSYLDMSWERNYAAAKKYYETHGDLKAVVTYTDENGVNLGSWLANLRTYRKSGIRTAYLTDERIAMLDELGMVWAVNDRIWEDNFAACEEYFREYGDLQIPHRYVSSGGLKIGAWVRLQRSNYEADKLSDEQIARLESIGMIWLGKFDQMWENGLSEAKAYFTQYGDLNVPTTYISPSGFRLGAWICNRRENGRENYSEKRRQQLDELGMIWQKPDAWEERFALAKQYFAEHGNLNVPPKYVANGVWLNKWLNEQKQIYDGNRPGKSLTAEQIQRLESIGMQWCSKSQQMWNEQYQCAVQFYRENGHLNVPRKYRSENGTLLNSWVQRQRTQYQTGKLTDDQIVLLEEIGMVWEFDDPWEIGFSHAKAYFEAHGNLQFPNNYICDDGYRLGSWIANQRQNFRKPTKYHKLTTEQIYRLESIGMVWNPSDEKWREGYEHAKEYLSALCKDKWSSCYVSPDGYKTGAWLRGQLRIAQRNGIDPRRRDMLSAIGVEF